MGKRARSKRHNLQSAVHGGEPARQRSADSRLRKRFKILPEGRGGPDGYAGIEEYGRRLKEQGGVCAICACQPDRQRRFAVDHSHATGKLRGLLCPVCNGRILGRLERFKKRITLVQIVDYLKKYDPENPLLRGLKES